MASYLLALVTLEMGLTVDFCHRFNNKFTNGKEFFKEGLKFEKVDIPSLNLNANFQFLWQNSRELLLFEYSPPSYQKFGFQLYADIGV